MTQTVFFLGRHPALSTAELVAYGQRSGLQLWWDTTRVPVALCASGAVPSPVAIQDVVGGTTMIGTLRGTFGVMPTPQELLSVVPSLLRPVRGKRLIGISALPCPAEPGGRRGACPTQPAGHPGDARRISLSVLVSDVRSLGMTLKRTVGMKGTRIVLPPGGRPYLSTAQLLHNRLPTDGTAIVLLVAPARSAPAHIQEVVAGAGGPDRVDVVTLDTIQDIRAYAERDRHRPHVDPGRGMLPLKVAQMLVNLSLVPPGGVLYDPFCGVGTIPMEAVRMGLTVLASDRSDTQVRRTEENLAWLKQTGSDAQRGRVARVFAHDVTRAAFPLDRASVDAIVTEGWLGPSRTTPPLPRDAEEVFGRVQKLIAALLERAKPVLRPHGRVVITVPAFRLRKRVLRFPLESLRNRAFQLDPLLPPPFDHAFAREAAQGTLLYGREDAIVLRDIVRFRRRE